MKRTIICSLLGILALGAAVTSQAQVTIGETEKTVAAHERQWLQSQKTNNTELLAPLLAEKFVNTGMDGKVTNKSQTLADAKATHWTSVEYENLQVVTYADAAIATGVYIGKGTDARGKPMDDQERFTDTWVRMPGGQWQCAASHQSAVKK
jgi:hypothetical protein